MQVFREEDDSKLLGIPYGSEESPERRFWNLRAKPSDIDKVPELSDYSELKEFVSLCAHRAVPLYTFGCEKWCKTGDFGSGLHAECGLYIDICFDTVERAAFKDSYEPLIVDLEERGKSLIAQNPALQAAILRLQFRRTAFYPRNTSLWVLSLWMYGLGLDTKMASDGRNFVLKEVSHAVTDLTSEPGTDLFSKIKNT